MTTPETSASAVQKFALLGVAALMLAACSDEDAEHGNVFDDDGEETTEAEPQPVAPEEDPEVPQDSGPYDEQPDPPEQEEDSEEDEDAEEEKEGSGFSGFSGEHLAMDPCDLLTGEELEEIYGLPYEEGESPEYDSDPWGEPEPGDDHGVQRYETCNWSVDIDAAGGGMGFEYIEESLQISVADYVFADDDPQSRQERSDAIWEEGMEVLDAEELTGFHYETVLEHGGFQPNEVTMRIDDTHVMISHGGEDWTADHAIAVAQQIEERILAE